jgi:RNA polymerase sigma-70 factor (ECF subfamily)
MTDLDDPDPDQATKRALVQLLPRLRRFCLALTAAPADADDLCQSTLERAIARLDLWTPGTRLDSWLYRMAQNLHKNALRDSANRLRLLETACEASDDQSAVLAHDEAGELRRHVLALPKEQREVLMLIGIEGYSYKECATLLDLPPTTVTNRLFQARMRLRRALEAEAPVNDASKRRASA